MHIEGQGTTEELATAVRKVYDKVKAVRAANPQPKDSFGANSVAGEKFDLARAAEQDLRNERRS